jgi:hypothetical protein
MRFWAIVSTTSVWQFAKHAPAIGGRFLRGRLKSLAQVKDRVADRIVIDTMDGNNWWDKNVSERFAG